MDLLFKLCNITQSATLRLFGDLEVEGLDNVPPAGPLIVVANHQSNFDPPLLGCIMPRRIRFLAKDNLFGNPMSRWFFSQYGAFPLNREGTDIRALRWALSYLRHDGALALFPEGTRGRHGMRKARSGIARIAQKSQARVLPVGITGTDRLGSPLRAFYPTGKITVTIGESFTLPAAKGAVPKDDMESMTEKIMRSVAALVPENLRGVYGASAPEREQPVQSSIDR